MAGKPSPLRPYSRVAPMAVRRCAQRLVCRMSRQSLFGYCLLCHGFGSFNRFAQGLAMPMRHTHSLTLARLSSVSKATLRHSQARAPAVPVSLSGFSVCLSGCCLTTPHGGVLSTHQNWMITIVLTMIKPLLSNRYNLRSRQTCAQFYRSIVL